MTEFYVENFKSYSEIFKKHASSIAELMEILENEIISRGIPPVGRTEKLFRMVLDLLYHVDQSYKKKYEIDEPEFKLTTYMSEEDVIGALRTAIKEELVNLNGNNNGTK
jgi:hypothetical protein